MTLPTLDALMERSLVPGASGPFVKIMSAAQVRDGDARAVLIERVRTLWDPWTCPVSELPLLAWAWSIDIWDEGWPDTRKRAVIAGSRAYHERKTTVAGYRLALGYRDATLVRANLPRHGFFVGRAATPEAHGKWLASLPEIRIYANTPNARPGGKGFFASRTVARAISRSTWERRRAELIRNGVATPLVIAGLLSTENGTVLSEPEKLLIPSPTKRVFRAGGFVGWPIASRTLAGQRVLSLSYTRGGGAFIPNAISPSLTPADVTPQLIAQPRTAGMGFFANRSRYRRGVRANDADFAFYLSLRLADGSTAEIGTYMRNRIGRTRLRRPSYTAGLLVHAPRQPVPSLYARGRVSRLGPVALVNALESAIDKASAARDTLFMDLNSTRDARFGDLALLPDDARYGRAVLN